MQVIHRGVGRSPRPWQTGHHLRPSGARDRHKVFTERDHTGRARGPHGPYPGPWPTHRRPEVTDGRHHVATGSTGGPSQGGPTGPQRRSVMGGGAEQRPPASFAPTGSTTGHGGPPAVSGRRAAGGARTGTPTAAAGAARAVGRPTGYHRFIDYPRHDKTGVRRWLPSWRLLLGLFLTGVVAVVLVIVIWYNSVPIPTPVSYTHLR